MNNHSPTITTHYTQSGLLEAIERGLRALAKTPSSVTVEELAAVDEFHIGGRQASEALLTQLNLTEGQHVLDIGCGLGGPARFVATRYSCQVTGIDMTPAYVATGNTLCQWVKLDNRVTLQEGNACALPFADATFDGAYQLHVGMNIAEKEALCAEIYRVLRPGAYFGIYDIMLLVDDLLPVVPELPYPMPWATDATMSFVAPPHLYRQALTAAGFTIVAERNRGAFAKQFFQQVQANTGQRSGPPPLGIHLLMGENAGIKLRNMIGAVSADQIAPVELIVQKR